MIPLPPNLGQAGAGALALAGAVKELQGLTFKLLATISADTYITVPDLGENDSIKLCLSMANGTAAYSAPATTGRTTGVYASGTVTISGTVAVGATVTFNGVVFTAVAVPTKPTEFLASATVNNVALSLKNAINAYYAAFTGEGGNGYREKIVVATVSSGVVTITATKKGTAANSYALAKSGSNIAVSGATLANGSLVNQIKFAGAHDNVLVVFHRRAGAL